MKRISTILPGLVLLALTGCVSKPVTQPTDTTKPPQAPHKSVSKADTKPQIDTRLPNVTVPVIYPQRALDQGIEGYVTLEFNVTKTGTLENIKVIDSSPPGYFEQEALRAASQFRYEPKIVNGQPVDIPRAQYKMLFALKYLRPQK
jgi:TonB family protein